MHRVSSKTDCLILSHHTPKVEPRLRVAAAIAQAVAGLIVDRSGFKLVRCIFHTFVTCPPICESSRAAVAAESISHSPTPYRRLSQTSNGSQDRTPTPFPLVFGTRSPLASGDQLHKFQAEPISDSGDMGYLRVSARLTLSARLSKLALSRSLSLSSLSQLSLSGFS